MENVKSVPLTADEKDLLFTIFRARKRLLIVVLPIFYFLQLVGLAFYALYTPGLFNSRIFNTDIRDVSGELYKNIFCYLMLPFDLLITAICGWLYLANTLPYKKDAEGGMKEAIGYEITGKMYFPLTDQYFLNLDNPDYLNHEVDADFYNSCEVGSTAVLYRAPHSKYYFEKDGKFTIM